MLPDARNGWAPIVQKSWLRNRIFVPSNLYPVMDPIEFESNLGIINLCESDRCRIRVVLVGIQARKQSLNFTGRTIVSGAEHKSGKSLK